MKKVIVIMETEKYPVVIDCRRVKNSFTPKQYIEYCKEQDKDRYEDIMANAMDIRFEEV